MPEKNLNEAAEELTGRGRRKNLMKELNESQLGKTSRAFRNMRRR